MSTKILFFMGYRFGSTLHSEGCFIGVAHKNSGYEEDQSTRLWLGSMLSA